MGITSRCLRHAAARSRHSRAAGQSAERSEHSTTTQPQALLLASPPRGPCWQSRTTTAAPCSTQFGFGRLAHRVNHRRSHTPAERPDKNESQCALRSRRWCQIPIVHFERTRWKGPSPHFGRGRNTPLPPRMCLIKTGLVDTGAVFFTQPALALVGCDASDTHFFSPLPSLTFPAIGT